jgi:hypothetical protein
MAQARDWQAIAERIQSEGPLPVSKAAKLVRAERGRRGHCSSQTLLRWILSGKQGVFLDAYRMAGETWYTSEAALTRFAAQLSALEFGKRQAESAIPTPTDVQRRVEAAKARLAELRKQSREKFAREREMERRR